VSIHTFGVKRTAGAALSAITVICGCVVVAQLSFGCASGGSPEKRKCEMNCYSLNRQCIENCEGMRPRIGFDDPRGRTDREQAWHWTAGACIDECDERERRCLDECANYTIMKSLEGNDASKRP